MIFKTVFIIIQKCFNKQFYKFLFTFPVSIRDTKLRLLLEPQYRIQNTVEYLSSSYFRKRSSIIDVRLCSKYASQVVMPLVRKGAKFRHHFCLFTWLGYDIQTTSSEQKKSKQQGHVFISEYSACQFIFKWIVIIFLYQQ